MSNYCKSKSLQKIFEIPNIRFDKNDKMIKKDPSFFFFLRNLSCP